VPSRGEPEGLPRHGLGEGRSVRFLHAEDGGNVSARHGVGNSHHVAGLQHRPLGITNGLVFAVECGCKVLAPWVTSRMWPGEGQGALPGCPLTCPGLYSVHDLVGAVGGERHAYDRLPFSLQSCWTAKNQKRYITKQSINRNLKERLIFSFFTYILFNIYWRHLNI